MDEQLLREVNTRIRIAGGKAYIVGGYVRDLLLKRTCKDVDIEVYGLSYDALSELFPDADLVGKSFASLKWNDIDITLPRIELKTGAGHRGFTVTSDPDMDPELAASRRDFTMNALMLDMDTDEVLDFFGGRDHLERKIISHINSDAFVEDPLRVLRAIQFASRFQFMIDTNTMYLCRIVSDMNEFSDLPTGRVGDEWDKLMMGSVKPSWGLRYGVSTGAWHALHPELISMIGCPQPQEHHGDNDVWTHALEAVDRMVTPTLGRDDDHKKRLLYAALLHDVGKPVVTEHVGKWRSYGHDDESASMAAQFLLRVNMPLDESVKIQNLIHQHMFTATSDVTTRTVKRLATRLWPATVEDLITLCMVDIWSRPNGPSEKRKNDLSDLREVSEHLGVRVEPVKPILQGRDLIEHLHLSPSPLFGRVLSFVMDRQLDEIVIDVESGLREARWFLACDHDEVDPHDSFVVFSEDNPYRRF